jgi:hypothetical protein
VWIGAVQTEAENAAPAGEAARVLARIILSAILAADLVAAITLIRRG